MFIINRNSSCYSIGFLKSIDNNDFIIQSLSKSLFLKEKNDVIITSENLENFEVYNNAKLYLEIEQKPKGVPLFIEICSAKIHSIVNNWEFFLKRLSVELNSDLFIETNNEGYIFNSKGEMKIVRYDYFYYNDVECLYIFTN